MVNSWQMLGLGLTYIVASTCFFLFLLFIDRFLRVRKTTKELLPFLGLAALFLCNSVAFILASWFDFLRWQYNESSIPLFKAYGWFLSGGLLGLTFIFEFTLKKTKYLISIYTAIGLIVQQFWNTLQDIVLVMLITGAPLYLILPILYYFIFIRSTSGFLRRRMYIAWVGSILAYVGLAGLGVPFFPESIGSIMFALSRLCMIIGNSFFGYGFAAFSTFTDLSWKKKLRELFVISSGGKSLYAFSFDQDCEITDSGLLAGGLAGIQMLLSEIVRSTESLQLIEYQDAKLMVEQRPETLFVLILREASTFLQYKLHLFVEEFEAFFKDIMPHWSGQVELFAPTKTLIHRVFEIPT